MISSTLIGLPMEVLQRVLWHMCSGTFLISLFVCKAIFHAAKSRHLMLHHLRKMPGLSFGLEDLDDAKLFIVLRQRAVKALVASNVLSDVTLFTPYLRELRTRLCRFSTGNPNLLAIVYKTDELTIDVFALDVEGIKLKTKLRPALEHMSRISEVHLVHVAFANPSETWNGFHLAGLYQTTRGFNYIVVIFQHLYSTCSTTWRVIEIPPSRVFGAEPMGLALSESGKFCITWQQSRYTSMTVTESLLYEEDEIPTGHAFTNGESGCDL